MWNLGSSIDSNAYSWRKIKSGAEYDYLFPKASGEVEIINQHSHDIDETMKLVYRNSIKYAADTAKLAPLLRGKTLYETLKNIWTFTYNHLQYKIDEVGKEQVRRPKRSWADRHKGVDCDCMSVFVGSILYNLHIDFKYRITMYEGSNAWQHIYVVVPVNTREYYVIDCVLHQFNFEKLPIKQYKDYDIMQLSSLNGVDGGMGVIFKKKATPASNQRHTNQKGRTPSAKPTVKEKIQAVVQKATAGKPKMTLKEKVQNVGKAFVKVVGAPSRNSFLLLFKVAKLTGITKKLREGAQKQWTTGMKCSPSEWQKWHKVYLDLSEMWTKKLQGQQFALDRAINGKEFAQGNTIRGLGRAISEKEWYLMDAEPYINGLGATGIEEGALMAAAAPVLIAFFDLLQKGGVLSKDKTSAQYAQDVLGDKEFNEASALVDEQASKAGDTEMSENGGTEDTQRTVKGMGDFWEQYKMPIMIGGGALAIGAGYWAWKQHQAAMPKKSNSSLSGVRRKKRKANTKRKTAKVVHLD